MSVAIVMPTIPRRAALAQETLKVLIGQCDRLYVHLDGYTEVPSWMPAAVRCFVHPQQEGPIVRFSVVPDEEFALFVDDDLAHPSDYVQRSIEALSRLGPRCAIAYHASWWPPKSPAQYSRRTCLPFSSANSSDVAATYIGCGTLALRTSDLCLIDRAAPKQFAKHDDVWISAALARAGIRCIRPPSTKNWIRLKKTGAGLFKEAAKDGFRERNARLAEALALGGWKLTR